MKYPIAEIFHSIQGEGFWTGTPMMFVRLAGCNVGSFASVEESYTLELQSLAQLRILNPKHSICTTLDGQKFLCDTDYHAKETLTAQQIFSQLKGQEHVCITGGEPFMHDLTELIKVFDCVNIHIETSGTKQPVTRSGGWVTCCPKWVEGGLHPDIWVSADEWKLLVGPDFKEDTMDYIEAQLEEMPDPKLYLQPINGIDTVWQANLTHCLQLLQEHPNWKLSAQLHKYLEVR